MKSRIIIFIVGIFFNINELKAQCAIHQNIPNLLSGLSTGLLGNTGPFTVRLDAHVIRRADGSGGLSISDLYKSIDLASQAFLPHNICLSLHSIDFVDDDLAYDWPGYPNAFTMDHMFDYLKNTILKPDAINIYYLPSTSPLLGGVAGQNYDCVMIGGTWPVVHGGQLCALTHCVAHEIGHCFSLNHTFAGSPRYDNGGAIPENVERTGPHKNCDIAGDGFCDTPASLGLNFGFAGEVNKITCDYVDIYGDLDIYGVSYNPDPGNIMDYTYTPCQKWFSLEQGQAMRDVIFNYHLPSRVVPDHLYIQNAIFNSNPQSPRTEILYAAPLDLASGDHVVASSLGPVQIYDDARVVFKAKNFITLEEGFVADATKSSMKFEAIVDPNLCSITSQISDARVANNPTKLDNNIINFVIFPNPSKGIFTLKNLMNTEIEKTIIISDILGNNIWDSLNNIKNEITIDISSSAKGIYFVKIVQNGVLATYKIIYM